MSTDIGNVCSVSNSYLSFALVLILLLAQCSSEDAVVENHILSKLKLNLFIPDRIILITIRIIDNDE